MYSAKHGDTPMGGFRKSAKAMSLRYTHRPGGSALCPECREAISRQASICPHCRSDLNNNPKWSAELAKPNLSWVPIAITVIGFVIFLIVAAGM